MSGFWNWWIIGLVVANILFAVWLMWVTSHKRADEKGPVADTTGHVWDGDLQEFSNPLPRWWLGLFYITIAIAVVYLVMYPGLGVYQGSLGWSQAGQWRAQKAQADAVYEKVFARFRGMSAAELAADPEAMRIAKNLFSNNCAMCHGSDARGAKGFPNLTAAHWQWGRDPAVVEQTIANGRQAVMPTWQAALGADGVEEVANYVYSLNGRSAPKPALVAAGQAKFAMFCVACHGPDAKGNPALGAPNLTDDIWLYGGSIDTIKETIAAGRQNRMPAWLATLGEQKVKIMAAYALSLNGPIAAASAAPAAASETAPVPAPHATGT